MLKVWKNNLRTPAGSNEPRLPRTAEIACV